MTEIFVLIHYDAHNDTNVSLYKTYEAALDAALDIGRKYLSYKSKFYDENGEEIERILNDPSRYGEFIDTFNERIDEENIRIEEHSLAL